MRLAEVRRWASRRGVTARDFRNAYGGALLHSMSRMLQAVYRESGVTRLEQNARGGWSLEIGRAPVVTAPCSGPLPFKRIEIVALAWAEHAGVRRELRSIGTFLRALKACLE